MNVHLTPTVLLEGVPIVTKSAELAVLSFRVVQALEAPPSLLVTGFWVCRVNVVVTVARLTCPPNIRGIAKEARGTVIAPGAYCPMKASTINTFSMLTERSSPSTFLWRVNPGCVPHHTSYPAWGSCTFRGKSQLLVVREISILSPVTLLQPGSEATVGQDGCSSSSTWDVELQLTHGWSRLGAKLTIYQSKA